MPIVSEKMLQAAFDYYHDQGDDAAQAKANLILAEHRRKKTRSRLILASVEKTMGLREAEADCSPEYEEACVVESQCAERVEWHRHMRARSDAIIEAWRSLQANERGLRRIA